MKKRLSILVMLAFICNILLGIFLNISFASSNKKSKKNNIDSYWSTNNAPLFYGTTKITLRKDILDNFDLLDARFRIFAKDFEDGDLTPQITHSENVNINEIGNYEIIYKVTDSHHNLSTLTVPVIVTDNENVKINVERTLYTTPSVWNMDLAGFSRCNYGDRQILGVHLAANQSIKARVITSENNINVNFFNNDSYNETSHVLPTTGEWTTLENTKDGIGYDAVPLVKTAVLSKANTQINKTFKLELEYDETIKPLNYYHYLDNEENFRNQWTESQNSYSVIENEVLTLVVPLTDMPYMTNYYKNGFKSLDLFLEYYQKVVEKMDEYVGLDFNPEKITDQNVRTKYLVKANVHGVGAAYYAGDHVGVNNASMRSFFEMNWGGLHELAHGYQGSLGKGEMLLGEVANNILGHYIQIDKNIYFHQGDWLGSLPSIEENRNEQRLSGKTFLEVDEPTRLYVIINLFNKFEGGTTYAKMFSWYREQLNLGRTMTNQDAYVESIADIYNINIIPYMEDWGLNISDSTKSKVYQNNYPLINILKDFVQEDNLQKIMINENFDKKYSLITNDIFQKYEIKSDLTINIDIDDFSKINGKVILLKQGNETIKSIKIDNVNIKVENVPIGTYFLQMPVIDGYGQDYIYAQVKEGQETDTTYIYSKLENVDYNNYLKMQVLGYNFDTIAYQLTFKNNYSKAKISYPNQSSMSGNEYIKIYNSEGTLITEDVSTGGYFDFNKGSHEIEIDVGYVIEVKYPNKYNNKVKVFSTLTGNLLSEYNATDTITRYVVIDNGLIREDMSEDTANEIAYEQIKPSLIAIIENYKSKVTDTELNNKFINFKEKAEVIDAYTRLNEKDQIPYTSLITAIKRGGSPIVTAKLENLEYKVGEEIDLYNLITAIDNEDGTILINKSNTVIETRLDNKIAGTYDVIYKVSDSDNNITTKTLQIKIIADQVPEEKPELPDEEPEFPDEEPDIPDEDEDKGETEDEDQTITDGDDNNQISVDTPISPNKALDKDINENVNTIQISETVPNSSNNKQEEDNNQELETVNSDTSNQDNNNFVEEEKILPNEIEEENHAPNKIDLSANSEDSSHLIIKIVMLLLASATCLFIVIKKIRQHDRK